MKSLKYILYNALRKWAVKRMSFYKKLISDINKNLFFEKFQYRKSDVFIVTFFKSGTTWMQMILHQMLHPNTNNFKHIYDVSPWLSNHALKGNTSDLIDKLESPRVFKSHDIYSDFDPEMNLKYVFVFRNVLDVCLSMYHHEKNYTNPNVTFEEIFEDFFSDKVEYNYYSYVQEWLTNNNTLDVLYVKYEDLKSDFDN